MKIFFTSDTHFGHANVIPYCNRPFRHVDHMNEVLVQNWNAVVSPEDVVFHMGDFSFHERYVEAILPRLNGYKVLILGNHDKPHPANKGKTTEKYNDWVTKFIALGWSEVYVDRVLDVQGTVFRLCHLPYSDPEDFYQDQPGMIRYVKYRPEDDGLPQLCGHVHERWLTKRTEYNTIMLNVGVDAPGAPWRMRPATADEVMEVYRKALRDANNNP